VALADDALCCPVRSDHVTVCLCQHFNAPIKYAFSRMNSSFCISQCREVVSVAICCRLEDQGTEMTCGDIIPSTLYAGVPAAVPSRVHQLTQFLFSPVLAVPLVPTKPIGLVPLFFFFFPHITPRLVVHCKGIPPSHKPALNYLRPCDWKAASCWCSLRLRIGTELTVRWVVGDGDGC
jgi:hypothetical protein